MRSSISIRRLLLKRCGELTPKRRSSRPPREFSFERLEARIQFAVDYLAELASSPEHCDDDMFTTSPADQLVDSHEFAAEALSDTFSLHSLPGASKVIFLDFDGHTTSGTQWNSRYTSNQPFTTPAYSTDGNSSFSDAELTRIQAIWARVAEDFLPFNVDVTTQDPGVAALRKSSSSDTQYGIRVVIGGSASDWYTGGAGGVAYVGSFDDSTDTPAFVFEENLSNGSEKSTAEASSHEAGHSLGLNHDGTSDDEYYSGHGSGSTGWAPIMGSGYSRPVTQWSRGEYPDADNTQNDLSVIVQTANGFTYRTDDHGNANASATPLTIDDLNVSATGIIERSTDRDYFSFTTGPGTVSFTVNPAAKGPNLDIFAAIFDASGAQIVNSNSSSQLSATLSARLQAGTYYLAIDGVGKPASGSDPGYSDYGSLGYFSITGQVALIPVDGDLGGVVWNDEDRDGTRGPEESGLGGWTVYIDGNNNASRDQYNITADWTQDPLPIADGGVTSATIDVPETGQILDVNVAFDISHASLGDLYLTLTSPTNQQATLLLSNTLSGADFTATLLDDEADAPLVDGAAPFTGSFRPATPLSIFDGLDAAGVWTLSITDAAGNDAGTLNDWSLQLTAGETATTTGADGSYEFQALAPGTYVIRELLLEQWEQTYPVIDGAPGSDAHEAIVIAGQTISNLNFGNALVPLPEPNADFNDDDVVDGEDFLLWQRGLGTPSALPADGDANNDGSVDGGDLAVWGAQFGNSPLPPTPESQSTPLVGVLMPRNAWIEYVNPVAAPAAPWAPTERATELPHLQSDVVTPKSQAARRDTEPGEYQPIGEQPSIGVDELALESLDAALTGWFPRII